MANPLAYHRSIQNEQHVFLCCVGGRSSSTAFQRIINSSNKVWIWGEPNDIINKAVSLINHMKKFQDNDAVKHSLTQMYHSYNDNKHLLFYPGAIGNLDSTIELINSSISNNLKPWAPKVKRFGFKDILAIKLQTLEHLKEIYPQSYFVFCFRNPLTQWPSVRQVYWPMSKNVNFFLDEYFSISNTYLEFAQKSGIKTFVENDDLRDRVKVNEIIKYLNILKIDSSLINVTVSPHLDFALIKNVTAPPISEKLSKIEEETILNSDAYKNYTEMRDISATFYTSIDD